MFGRPHHKLRHSDGVDVLELGNLNQIKTVSISLAYGEQADLGEHGRDLAEVPHVDAAVVDGVSQRRAVHGRRGVVKTVADEAGNLDRDQEVGSILDQLLLL